MEDFPQGWRVADFAASYSWILRASTARYLPMYGTYLELNVSLLLAQAQGGQRVDDKAVQVQLDVVVL